jgi:hypothetical protein
MFQHIRTPLQHPKEANVAGCSSFHAGRAEPLHLALHIANTPLEGRRITKEEFQQLKKDGKLPYRTVPILEVRSATCAEVSGSLPCDATSSDFQ